MEQHFLSILMASSTTFLPFSLDGWKSQITSNGCRWNACVLHPCSMDALHISLLTISTEKRSFITSTSISYGLSSLCLIIKDKAAKVQLFGGFVGVLFRFQSQISRVCDEKLIHFLGLWLRRSFIWSYSLTIFVVFMFYRTYY